MQTRIFGRVHDLILAAEKPSFFIMRIVDQYMGFYTPLVLLAGALVWGFPGSESGDHRFHHCLSMCFYSGYPYRYGGCLIIGRKVGYIDQKCG